MNLVRSAQSKCVLGAAEGFFRRKLRKQMKRNVFFVASSDSDDNDDEVIFVSSVPPRVFVSLFLYFDGGFPPFHHYYVRDANFDAHPCTQMAARHSLIFMCARACRGTEAMRRSIRVGCAWCMQ